MEYENLREYFNLINVLEVLFIIMDRIKWFSLIRVVIYEVSVLMKMIWFNELICKFIG